MNTDNGNELENEPSPFLDHKSDSNKQVEITEFSTWYSKIFLTNPNSYPEHPIKSVENDNTSTIRYLVVYTKPKQDYIDFIEGTQDHVCFWIKNFFLLKEGFDELAKYIKSLFKSIITEKLIFPLLKGDINDIQPFKQVKLRKDQLETKEKKRIVFHYIAHQTEKTPLDGIEFLNYSCFQLKDLLDIFGESSLYIFDRDKAGSLFPIFSEYAQSKNLENYLIAFFACGANELLPRSSDYPIDLFTSCLNSPARIALVWHSRQYFCFQSGSLQPLSLMFVEEMEAFDGPNNNSNSTSNQKNRIKLILDDITSSLRSIVESMALHSMEPQLFVKLFRTDKVLSKLTVNFIFACHILSIFNIHPISYPKMPDMSNSSEWHTFALRLDASLYILNHPEEDLSSSILSHHHFLSQTLITFQNKIDINSNNLNSKSKSYDSPFELSFFRSIIKDKNLCEPALKTLAKYLDSSPASIIQILYFPIPHALFKLLIKNGPKMPSKYLIFCLVKILAYYHPARSLLLKMNTSYQNMITKVLIDAFRNCILGNSQLSFQSFSSLSSLSSAESIPKSISMTQNRPSSFAQASILSGFTSKSIVNQNVEINSKDMSFITSSTSLNFSAKKAISSNSSTDQISLENITVNNCCVGDPVDDSADYPIISHLLMILFSLLMKDSFKLFKEIIIPQNLFYQSSDQNIFSQQTIDQLGIDSKIWLLLIITKAAEATKDYQIIKKLLSLILKVYNSKPPQTQIQIQLQKNLIVQPPPELHAAIVCALSSLIKIERALYRTSGNAVQIRETIEHNAAKTAFNFLESSLVNVRLELFVMAQKFIKANPTVFSIENGSLVLNSNSIGNQSIDDDQDQEILYKKVLLCVQQSEKDPNESVRTATNSTLFKFFNSALLTPIRKMLFGPYSLDEISRDPYQFDSLFTLSSTASIEINENENKEEKEASQKETILKSTSNSNICMSGQSKHSVNQRTNRAIKRALVVNSSYKHELPITSKLIYLTENKIAFGDATGFINIKDWRSGPKFQILPQKGREMHTTQKVELRGRSKISNKPLTCIEFYENGLTKPLLFSVDTCHDCRVSSLQLPDCTLDTTAVFPLFKDNKVYLDRKRGHLYSFNFDDGDCFRVRDLRSDSFLSPIVPKFGSTRDVKSFGYFDDVVAVCGKAFELFDLRASNTEPVKSVMSEFETPPISMRVIDESIPTFAIALENHIAVYLDSRHETWLRSIAVPCMCKDEDMVTCGFDLSVKSAVAAIGTEHGITCIQMLSNFQSEVVNKKPQISIAYSKGLLFHPEKYELAFVCNQEYIITAI